MLGNQNAAYLMLCKHERVGLHVRRELDEFA